MKHEKDPRLALLSSMMRIRCTEETLARLYEEEREMRTPTHFSIGQEAVAVGVSAALRKEDVVYSGHRCHAHYLAKGGDLVGMVAELYGKANGCARGRGGSVHLNDPKAGVIASSAILGQTIATAVGTALAFKMDRMDRIAVTYFGDGAVEEGAWHESLNFAAVRKVPVLFVCENNLYSTLTSLSVRQPAGIDIFERVRAYTIPSQKVDGNDVFAVFHAASDAAAHIRGGGGPYFLECMTYRWREHVGPLWDYTWGYRTKEEVDSWIARCPINRATEGLMKEGLLSPAELERMKQEIQQEVDAAVAIAKKSPFPSLSEMMVGTY